MPVIPAMPGWVQVQAGGVRFHTIIAILPGISEDGSYAGYLPLGTCCPLFLCRFTTCKYILYGHGQIYPPLCVANIMHCIPSLTSLSYVSISADAVNVWSTDAPVISAHQTYPEDHQVPSTSKGMLKNTVSKFADIIGGIIGEWPWHALHSSCIAHARAWVSEIYAHARRN